MAGPGLLVFVAVLPGCGGSSGTGPTPGVVLTAPSPVSPVDDAQLVDVRPVLEVSNATSSKAGQRNYEFQVADNSNFAPPSSTPPVQITKTVSEGADGKTSYQVEVDLPLGVRLFWRARAVQDSVTGPFSATSRMRMPPGAGNQPPAIRSLTSSSPRAEVDTQATLTAAVTDSETPGNQLIYEWTATAMAGTFSGTGPVVRWRAPKGPKTPATYDLTLTVTERYTEVDFDGVSQQKEHKVTAAVTIDVNDSSQEITDLSLLFLKDFSDSNVPAAQCVRNFSDRCPGKGFELSDINFNRQTRTILASTYRVDTIALDGAKVRADVKAPCTFTSRINSSGQTEQATGDCLFTTVYESKKWLLCDSLFRGTTSTGLRFTLQ